MGSQKLPAALWLIAGISSAGIALFLVEPLDLAIFIGGAVLAILLGLSMVARPARAFVLESSMIGSAWCVTFGAIILTRLHLPIEQLLSVVWILAFGLAGAVATYLRRSAREGA